MSSGLFLLLKLGMFNFYDSVRVLRDHKTKVAIGIEWINDDGTKQRYYPSDLSEDWFINYVDDVRRSENLERKERYHVEIHFESMVYEGDYFTDGSNPRTDLNWLEEQENVSAFIATLTEVERRRLEMKLDNPKMSFEKIGEAESVSKVAIFKTFTSIRSKYNSFFC